MSAKAHRPVSGARIELGRWLCNSDCQSRDDACMTTDALEIDAAWREWIALNLARGCTTESLVSAMIKSGIRSVDANAALQAHHQSAVAPNACVAPPAAAPHDLSGEQWPNTNELRVGDRVIRMSMVLASPSIRVLDGVLSDAECDEIIRRASQSLSRSTVVDPESGAFAQIEARTSEGMYFMRECDPFIAMLDSRIATLLGRPVENGEGLQVLHYRAGGEYRPHFDYFPPEHPGSAWQMRKGGQRVATLVMYLNDVPAGGGTAFPELQLEVAARKGTAVWFEYCDEVGRVDPRTLHAGLPVLAGEKWIMTKWVRQHRFGDADGTES